MGLPASGKTTRARQIVGVTGNTVRINKDDLRSMTFNNIWSSSREKSIIAIRNSIIDSAMQRNLNIVVDDTNLHPKHYETFKRIVKEWNSVSENPKYTLEIDDSFLSVSPHECIERDKKREISVGSKVIWDMYRKYIKGTEKDPIKKPDAPEWNNDLPSAIICDLDGTLALMQDRSPYDASRAGEDIPNFPVVDLVQTYRNRGVEVVFVTARENSSDGSYYEITDNWIRKFVFSDGNFSLIMRENGDHRKDSIVKKEMYEQEILNNWNIMFVVDDRPQVIRMWKELGLFVLNVGDCIDF
jgi:predicted kinase